MLDRGKLDNTLLTCDQGIPLAHRTKRGARVLISTSVESFYTRSNEGKKFSHSLSMFLFDYISMDFGHSRTPCDCLGTGMLLNKQYLGTVLKQIDLVSFFFLLHGSLASCLHYLNTEASK